MVELQPAWVIIVSAKYITGFSLLFM